MNKKPQLPVSVIISMRNAATTVLETLKTVSHQQYPIDKIIVVDNVSRDTSREIVRKFALHSKIKVLLICQKKDNGVSSSYNAGAKRAKTPLIVFLSSDSSLPTTHELEKLTKPLLSDSSVVASFATTVLPGFIWNKYNFWEKYHAARMVDNRSSLMVTKFDCVRKGVFDRIGGFDEKNFGGDGNIGGEDADLSTRLRLIGKVIHSNALAYHLHYMANDYTLTNMANSRKMYARSYGRFLRKSAFLDIKTSFMFLVRPVLAVIPFIPGLRAPGVMLLILYAFLFTSKMFLTRETLTDPKIITIPLLNIIFLYVETYWMVIAFLTYKKHYVSKNL